MGRREAEERVLSTLRALGFKATKSQLSRQGVLLNLQPVMTVTFAGLVAQTQVTGEVPKLDFRLWMQTQSYLAVAGETDVEGLTTVLAGGPRSSPPMSGPGYQTNDVVSDMLANILIHRQEVADQSSFDGAGFRPCFRSYTAYLAACVTAIDAFTNRQRWYALHEPASQLTEAQKDELERVVRPLDHKLRRWTPVLTAGKTLDETQQAWREYTDLRVARNGYLHVNEPDVRFELRPATDALNKCRHGVGQLLIDLSAMLGHAPAPAMYRVRYAPPARFISKATAST